MATLYWQRSVASDVAGVKTTFSGWDQCMTKAYCKWPVIAGIIIGSLIVLSLLFCLLRILCFGAECCFCCASCMRCCGSCCSCCGGSGSRNNQKYAQSAPQYQPAYAYQSAQPPMYNNPAQPPKAAYAQFDAPSGPKGYRQSAANEDALPAMPSWDQATSRKVEQEGPHEEDVELEKMSQEAPMIPKKDSTYPYHGNAASQSGQMGMASDPYRDSTYGQQRQQSPFQPYGAQQQRQPSPYDPYGARQQQSPTSTTYQGYGGQQRQPSYESYNARQQQSPTGNPYGGYGDQQRSPIHSNTNSSYEPYQTGRQYAQTTSPPPQSTYAPSVPPSYHTAPPSVASGGVGRKPVQGSWRDL